MNNTERPTAPKTNEKPIHEVMMDLARFERGESVYVPPASYTPPVW